MAFNFFKKTKNKNTNIEIILADYHKRYPISSNPTVLSIVHSVSSTISTLGLDLYQRSKKGSYKVFDTSPARLMLNPNQEDTPSQFLYRISNDYLFFGNAYIFNIGGASLQILNPQKMNVIRNTEAPFNKIYVYDGYSYSSEQIIHIYNPQYYDGFKGHSPLEYNQDVIQLLNDLLLYVSVYFHNSGGERLAFTIDSQITQSFTNDEKLKIEFEKWLNEKILNPLASGKPVFLKDGIKIDNIKQTTNVEAELSSLIERVEREVAKLFSFPFYMLSGDYGNNLQFQQIHYYQSCILPMTEIFQEKFSSSLIPLNDKPYQYFQFSYDNLLLPDAETRHRIIREDIRGGVLTLNEGRKLLGSDLYGGDGDGVGDVLWIASNLVPATDKNKELYFANALKTIQQDQANAENSNPNTK